MSKKPLIGVLCFNLTIASTSVLSLLAKELTDYTIKAYPLFGPPPQEDLPFGYRPSCELAKGVAFARLDGKAPEVMLRNVGWSVVRDLVSESDIVMLLGIQALPAFLAALLARLHHKPLVTINQTMPPRAERQRSLWIRLPKSVVLHLSTVCVAMTPHTSATLSEVYHFPQDRIVPSLYDGGASDFDSVLEPFRAQSKQEHRLAWGIARESFVISFVGTLVHLKGVDLLLNALTKILHDHPDSLLLVIGPDGTEAGKRDDLESQAKKLGLAKHVRFLGSRSREQLAQLYLTSDVFVLPTRKDMWPKVLVEASLAGLPLVTTDVCGAAGYLVRTGENGYVVPSDNIPALTRALLQLRDPILRLEMGQASKQIVQEYNKPAKDLEGYNRAIQLAISLYRRS